MIIIFSQNNYLEQALRNFKIYQNLKIKTTQDEDQLKGKNRICIIDEMEDLNNQCQISITLSKIGAADLKKPFHISSLNILIIKCLTKLNNYIFLIGG